MKLYWPVRPEDGAHIFQGFGTHPELYLQFGLKGHNGLDFDVIEGTKIYASHDGALRFLKDLNPNGTFKGYGNYALIEASDGSQTFYAHMLKFEGIDRPVKAGEIIGYVDSTGFSSGDHLHFTYKPANADYNNGYSGAVDPLPLLFDKNIKPMEFVQITNTEFGLEFTTEFVTTVVRFTSPTDAKEKLKNIPGALKPDGSVDFTKAKKINL